ncbi:MAG: SGNH/GDSL hydrolase family protein [Phycisphaerae bacterium]
MPPDITRSNGEEFCSPANRAGRLATMMFGAFAVYSGIVAFVLSLLINLASDSIEIDASRYAPIFYAMLGHGVFCLLGASAAFIIRRRSNFSIAAARVILLVCTLGMLGSIELILEVVLPPPLPSDRLYQPHPVRGWTHIPGSESILIGADGITKARVDWHGLRIDETGPIRRIGEGPRVLSLGDSVGFGYYHPAKTACVTKAVDLLNARRPELNWVTLNACVAGYDTRQEYDLLINEGFGLDPKLVILQICLNDWTFQFDPASPSKGGLRHELLGTRPKSHWSGIGRAVKWLGRRLHDTPITEDVSLHDKRLSMRELLTRPSTDWVRRASLFVETYLTRIIEACRARGVALVVVCFPIDLQLADAGVANVPQMELREICGKYNVPFLDLLPVYLNKAAPSAETARLYLIDYCHPTRRGNEVAAETLSAFLEECGVVEQVQ